MAETEIPRGVSRKLTKATCPHARARIHALIEGWRRKRRRLVRRHGRSLAENLADLWILCEVSRSGYRCGDCRRAPGAKKRIHGRRVCPMGYRRRTLTASAAC